MRTKYAKPNSETPWINDHVEIKTRRVGSVTRVYVTHRVLNGEVRKGHKDFDSFSEMMKEIDRVNSGMIREGWIKR